MIEEKETITYVAADIILLIQEDYKKKFKKFPEIYKLEIKDLNPHVSITINKPK